MNTFKSAQEMFDWLNNGGEVICLSSKESFGADKLRVDTIVARFCEYLPVKKLLKIETEWEFHVTKLGVIPAIEIGKPKFYFDQLIGKKFKVTLEELP